MVTAPARPHLVHVERRRKLRSATLPPEVLARLQAAFRGVPWYRDPWPNRATRTAIFAELTRGLNGLVLIGPRMGFDDPAPFDEMFEPILFRGVLGDLGDQQLQIVSGGHRTRQDMLLRIGWTIGGVALFLAALGAAYGWWRGAGRQVALVGTMILGSLAFAVMLGMILDYLRGRWFIVPGGVVIVSNRRDARTRISLRTPRDTAAMLRYVSNGKSTILTLELWSAEGRRWHRAVSEREAVAFLAAWQSNQEPPTLDELAELNV